MTPLFSTINIFVKNSIEGLFRVCITFDVSRKFQGCLKEVFRVFHRSFKCNSRKFQGCFKEVSRLFQGSFKGFLRKFQGCFKEVSMVFQGTF